MMKRLYSCIFFIGFLKTIDGGDYARKDIISISSGTSFGECISYCRRSIDIKSKTNKLIALKEPNFPQAAYPPVQKQYPFSSNQWKQLINAVDSKDFRALNNTIGCPDCADGGAEWIQINWPNLKKRVTFEYGKSIKGFEGLINELRNLRKKYVDNL